MFDQDRQLKTYIDEAKQQYMYVARCRATFGLADKKTTLVITRLHNAVTVDPDHTPIYRLLSQQESWRLEGLIIVGAILPG